MRCARDEAGRMRDQAKALCLALLAVLFALVALPERGLAVRSAPLRPRWSLFLDRTTRLAGPTWTHQQKPGAGFSE